MRETIATPSTNPGSVGKFRDAQLPTRMTWGIVPDNEMTLAGMHVIHVIPTGSSTITHVNPTDPATEAEAANGWLVRPSGYAPVTRA